jgi:hypothetical protein
VLELAEMQIRFPLHAGEVLLSKDARGRRCCATRRSSSPRCRTCRRTGSTC